MARLPPEGRPAREALLLQVFVVSQLTGDLLRTELGDAMRGDRFAVQSVIRALAPVTPRDLARRLGMAPTTVSSWLSRLEADGSIRRRRNPEDGRSQLIETTAKGRQELDRAYPAFGRAVARVRAALGDDLDPVLDAQLMLIEALRRTLAEDTNS